MKVHLLAVGLRQPAWADTAYEEFAKRLPAEFKLCLKAVKAEVRGSRTVTQMASAEGERLLAAAPKGAWKVVLDERGQRLTTPQMADRTREWMQAGRDVAIFIGGPDGLSDEVKAQADETWRLSDLTLPHAMVRVMLAEAIYRAWTVMVNHPYHRE